MYQMFQPVLLAAQTGWKEIKFYDLGFFLCVLPIIFLYGITIGSFLNVVIIRLPRGESLIRRSSHCMTCGAKIRAIDLIPVFSWLFLHGRCHSCGEKISARYPIVEALNGLLYVANFFAFGFTVNMVIMDVFTSLLVVVGFMDWDTLEIDLRVLGIMALLSIPLYLWGEHWITIPERLIGAVCIALPFFIIGEVSRIFIKKNTGEDYRGIELGDTYLMAAAGLCLGWKAMIPSAFIGILLGAIGGIIIKKATGSSKFAFGPFLAMGLWIGAIFGEEITEWYIRRLPEPEQVRSYTTAMLTVIRTCF